MFLRYSFAGVFGLSLAALPGVASAEPHVIPGVGPAIQAPSYASQAYNQPPNGAPSYEPVQAPVEGGNYGGGFIEFMMTGNSASSNSYRAHAPQMTAYADPQAAAPRREINPIYFRQEVEYSGNERPGTIVIDTPNKFLFFVEPGGHALRYGIGVGRPGFAWSGVKTISRKAEWPGWTPPAEMLLRRPDLPTHMDGGPANPLGARALYLGSSLYRIHGTNEPETIGMNVSSGCIRMMNQDVEDLYGRVHVGTKVIVM
jgi:lipoprotein-anchoring transpeptidase ErfK/SrfK